MRRLLIKLLGGVDRKDYAHRVIERQSVIDKLRLNEKKLVKQLAISQKTRVVRQARKEH